MMKYSYDIVILGSGIAGITAGIMLKEQGFDVVLLTKEDNPLETATYYAQGGIIAKNKQDNCKLLKKDILIAGSYYNYQEAVELFAKEGPKLVFDFLIDKIGIEFSKTPAKELDYTEEAAHSLRRILHYEDRTGEIIQKALCSYAQKIGLEIKSDHTAIDLITNNHNSLDTQELYKEREVMGVYALNNSEKRVDTFFSHRVIIATGGLGNLYRHTTNLPSATGDGMSMAHRAGADIINAEFVQFHPTSLYHRDIHRFLISESLRGEGAVLLNHEGERFMQRYSEHMELAPRDVVARAIYDEMGRTGKEFMFLDIASGYKGDLPIKDRFPNIYNTCMEGGIDISKEPIPVVPAAHYFCGGIKADIRGRASIKNLYAIGEIACSGLHGANRLASTSLVEGLLWAKQAANDISDRFEKIDVNRFDKIPEWKTPGFSEEFDPLLFQQDWKVIQLTMWNYAGIIRTEKGLERAKSDLNYHAHRIFKFYKRSRLTKNIIELRNGVVNSLLIIEAALHNKKSIGCHYIKR
jgi:L-aspartate oxidase